MTPIINLLVARIVQFSETHYDADGIYLDFLVDELRPVIAVDGFVVDVLNHQVFEIVPMIEGVIPIDFLSTLRRDSLYAYECYDAIFEPTYFSYFVEKALETYKWYFREYKKEDTNVSSRKSKIIPFEEAKQKIIEKRKKQSFDERKS